MQSGPSVLVANPPSWNSNRPAQPLGHVEVVDGHQPIELDEAQAQRLLDALRDGLVPELTRPASANKKSTAQNTKRVNEPKDADDDTARLGLSPVNFQRAYAQYDECIGQLLPFSLAQMANTSIGFELDRVDLDTAARKKIDVLLRYIRADRRPVKIDIFAFSDDSYRRVENLELAKLRAQCINDYLVAHGIEQKLIVTNYRTERRGRNVSKRFVSIRWQRTAEIARR
jgi:outer membrane protein OmpA-like peptidoglycan-associated protein